MTLLPIATCLIQRAAVGNGSRDKRSDNPHRWRLRVASLLAMDSDPNYRPFTRPLPQRRFVSDGRLLLQTAHGLLSEPCMAGWAAERRSVVVRDVASGLSKAQPAVFPVRQSARPRSSERDIHAHASSAQQPDPPQGAVRAARSSACADVRVRPDGVRPGAYRQRTHHGGVRRDGAAAARAVSARHLCPQHHRCGRQDQRARERERRADRRDHRAHHGGLPCRHGGSRGAAAGSGTPRDAARRAR